jgi:hypothetical protein
MKNMKALLLVLASLGSMTLVACGDKDDGGGETGTTATEE